MNNGVPGALAAVACFAAAGAMDVFLPLEVAAEPATVCGMIGVFCVFVGADGYLRQREHEAYMRDSEAKHQERLREMNLSHAERIRRLRP